MLSIYRCTHKKFIEKNGRQVSVDLFEIFADAAADLTTAAVAELIGEDHDVAQGSVAWIISDASVYMYNSQGTWVKQLA